MILNDVNLVFFATYTLELAAAFMALTSFAIFFYKYGRWVGNKADKAAISNLSKRNGELGTQVTEFETRFERLEDVVGNPRDFWLQPSFEKNSGNHSLQLSRSIPIITVVNFKGGVGKTTICANLAGYFAQQGKRVLLIDFDYQGSLSDTVLSHAGLETAQYISHHLLEPDHDPQQLRLRAERLSSAHSNLWIFPAFYQFSKTEIQMMFRWLVGKDAEIRFNLHRYLQSEYFQASSESGFDLVLIDTAPRLLTGVVNALAASTHVLIPTILDGQSHLATINTMGALQLFRQQLNPNLKPLGVVPTLVSQVNAYNDREKHFIEELERQIPDLYISGPVPVLDKRFIVRREVIAKAGGHEVLTLSGRTDAKTAEIRENFANLAEYISQQVHWVAPPRPNVVALPGGRNGVRDEDQRIASGS